MKTEHLVMLLISTHMLAFVLGGMYYVNVYVKAYNKQKKKNQQIIDTLKSVLK